MVITVVLLVMSGLDPHVISWLWMVMDMVWDVYWWEYEVVCQPKSLWIPF
jgi:hypothetical protein